MTSKLLINCTHGEDDPERATLPFIVGNAAVTADQEAVVFLTVEGVHLATKGYADCVHKEGFQPLGELIRSFVGNGGQIWACGACTKPRGIADGDLIEGAKIVTAVNLVEYVTGGAATVHV
jgi:predicted peroxiredoxin